MKKGNDLKIGAPSEEDALFKIKEALKKIHYGALEIIIHDSKIVQIESREKFRFDRL